MKKSYLSAIALLSSVSLAPGALADDGWYGAFGAGVGHQELDSDEDSIGVDTYFGEGVIIAPISGNLAVQLDANYSSVSDDDFTGDVWTASGHLIWRGDGYAAGGYVGLIEADEVSSWVAGGEYAAFFGPATFALGAGYGQIDVEEETADLYGVTGEVRYFTYENLRFDGRFGWQQASEGGLDETILTYGVGGEWKPTMGPVSVFASYDRLDLQDFDASVDTYSIGLRVLFGPGDTLMLRDREGTTFRPFGGFESIAGSL